MKQKIFFIILALLILLPSCKSPSSPDMDGVTTGTINGTVTDTSTGSPIAGANVSTQPATTTTTTDAQGTYSISNVAPGSYTVIASASGYITGNASATVTGGQTATANLALQPSPTTGTISGTVTDESTGTPIAGASVSTQPATTTATTDTQGNYAISDADEGSYTVTASASGYFDESDNVTVTAGQTTTCNLALEPKPTTGTISGTVTEEGTGTPIAGASVSTQPATTIAISDTQGNYKIDDVAPGSYTLTASASGYTDDSTNVTVTAGQTSTANLALQADYSGSWSGTTTQGKSISFTIVNNGFTRFEFGWAIYGAYCTVNSTTTFTYSTPRAFSGNTFTISGSSYQMSYSFNGTFNSSTTASGTGSVSYSGSCPGSANFTWSVNKN